MTGPYADAAWAYRRAGWAGVLPLPLGAKGPPPGGFTGWAGVLPSGPDVQAWIDGPQGAGNIALRMPGDVYGLDVDDYGAKAGGAVLARLVEAYGPLPATWIVSSREDGLSGIRVYRAELPVGRRWRDEPGGHGAGIEAIHRGHRYAVVWPSVHPDTGRKYVWRTPDGIVADGRVPVPAELPELPAAWVAGLSEPGEVRAGGMAGHDEAVEAVAGWREGEACPRVAVAHGRALASLAAAADGAALHPASLAGVHELVNLGHEGHAGVRRALAEHHGAHVEVRSARGGDRADAEGEWWRMVRGAIGKLPAGTARAHCDCDLWSGAGLLFDPGPLPGDGASGGTDLFTAPAQVSDGGTAGTGGTPDPPPGPDRWATAVAAEALRLRLRHEGTELHRAQLHARTWVPPVSHGSLADELTLPDDGPVWRIQGLLGAGHNAILVAGRKAGKTTMINEFVRSYVDGAPFLGTQEVTPTGRGVAIFNYEIDERQYRRWLREVGIRGTDRVHVLHLRGRSLPLANPRVRAWVAQWLRERDIGAWVVDPYSRAYIGSIDSGNDEAQVSAFLDTLDQIKAEAGVDELVMPVHTPKARVEEGHETAIGSQRLEGWPDVMWYLTRDGKQRFIRAEGRDIDFRESELLFCETTRRLTVEEFGQDRKSARQAGKLKKLIAFVHANPECTTNDIREGCGFNAATISELVAASSGAVVVEKGANRSKLHILKSDITGGTDPPSPTAENAVPPGLVGGWDNPPKGVVTHHPTGQDNFSYPPVGFDPFRLNDHGEGPAA